MGQDAGDRHEPPEPAPEPFDVFYLREFPKVVGLLHGLLGSRLVAEELAQETFLVAFRDWGRISRLDNPRAWVRRVAINQRGSFLRAYLRQQTRERDAAVRYEDYSVAQVAAALLGVAATDRQDANGGAPVPAASTVAVTRPAIQAKVPDACVDSVELADEVISRLNRNIRDNRLAETLRAYTIASQACRRAASP
jgi:DNA-directed RNA polymerase specialized sigma24 family protein